MLFRTGLIVLVLGFFWTCRTDVEKPLFSQISPKQSGILFNNQITEYDTFNIFDTEFIYNGGGVAIGDLNGDQLPEVFFSGNQVDNTLYLNGGGLNFKDITDVAGLKKAHGEWSSGINFVDLNNDGRLDIYICNTMLPNPKLRVNNLFINQGNNEDGIPQFLDQAMAYGLADTTHASNAQFFDFDRDGDLDVFIAVNVMDTDYPNAYKTKTVDGSSPNCDRLYRQDHPSGIPHPVFTDVSKAAGLVHEGYSHSALITDINEDGWPDIYVANDYVTNDLIYINQKDGTFKNEIKSIFKHQAASAMGSDLGDMNNDGLLDLFTTEMMPYYNKRKKLFLNANNYNNYINNERYGYEYQYPRNTLQLNQGLDEDTALPLFSDVAFICGLQETEWSWAPLIMDFDHDGWNDIFITNGFPRDVTDHDFGAYRSTVSYLVPELELQAEVPQIKSPKFLYRNLGKLSFADVSKSWGVAIPAFSNGAAWGDLDADGDVDLVVNNINQAAFVFKNNLIENKSAQGNFIRLIPGASLSSADYLGLKATVYDQGKKQSQQIISARGYLSCSEFMLHFGIAEETEVDSIELIWPDHSSQTISNPPINQIIKIKKESHLQTTRNLEQTLVKRHEPEFFGLNYYHRDSNFIDFNFQRTLPHKYSEFGPSLVVGDVNGDGLDDIYCGGSAYYSGSWFLQTAQNTFIHQKSSYKTDDKGLSEELGTLLFDADNDLDLDLYITHGGNHAPPGHELYRHTLMVNDGSGNFRFDSLALPRIVHNGMVVKGGDYDRDGDLDLFIGGSIKPQAYPNAEPSMLLRNDSKPGEPRFSLSVLPALPGAGIVSDALWTDFNGDFWPDLIIVGEWMPLTFLANQNGQLVDVTDQSGLSDQIGWWTSLAGADLDQDGDIDYLAGNYGLNTYFQASTDKPLSVYAKDFDGNGLFDPFISIYWQDSLGQKHEYMYHTRDDAVKQLVKLKSKFQTYQAFGEATMPQMFNAEDLKEALIYKATNLSSSWVENLGTGTFKLHPLPVAAQLAPLRAFLPWDVDDDGDLDVFVTGNDFGMELLQGRADGLSGLILINHGKGDFTTTSGGFRVPGDGRALAVIAIGQKPFLLATQNRGPLEVFTLPQKETGLMKIPRGTTLIKYHTNNSTRIQEVYWGNSFLSQSTTKLFFDPTKTTINFFDLAGKSLPLN